MPLKRDSGYTASASGHSYFKSILDELSLVTRNTLRIPSTEATFVRTTRPTEVQARALELAGVKLA